MKRIPLRALLALLPLTALQAADHCDLATVASRDAELNRLIIDHDSNSAKQYYADAFVLTTSRGNRKYLADMLTEIRSTDVQFVRNETQDVKVIGNEHTAVLTAVLYQQGTLGESQFDHALWVTDTWICGAGQQWFLLAGQATKKS